MHSRLDSEPRNVWLIFFQQFDIPEKRHYAGADAHSHGMPAPAIFFRDIPFVRAPGAAAK